MSSSRPPWPPIPKQLKDSTNEQLYQVGKLLGKGGFAKVHSFTPIYYRRDPQNSNEIIEQQGPPVAGKIVAKNLLMKSHQKEKMGQEINLHKSLKHNNIVQFHSNFVTNEFVIITLELCARRSLMELHKRRGKILEPEARFYMSQVQKGVMYLHEKNIIHRDLKLGNVFLDDKLTCKIGDFGLAAKMDMEGTQRKTMCGTPNYLAPEILKKEGHDYQVDIWSAGCMLYTLIVGKPPFETSTLKETYTKIKSVNYKIPPTVSNEARQVIKKMLERDPQSRPKIQDLSNLQWFSLWTPSELPVSALTTEPRFDEDEENQMPASMYDQNLMRNARQPNLPTIHADQEQVMHQYRTEQSHQKAMQTINKIKKDQLAKKNTRRLSSVRHKKEHDVDPVQDLLPKMINILRNLIDRRPHRYQPDELNMNEAEKPELSPLYWITKWVDFQDKYGFGYCLSEGHYGVNFRDDERTVLNANLNNLMYIDKRSTEHHYTKNARDWPDNRTLEKKIQLTDHFIDYMRNTLLTAGRCREGAACDDFARIPYLRKWLRVDSSDDQTSNNDGSCIAFLLTNGVFQCNFHKSHVKVIICPLMKAITFLSYDKYSDRTFGIEELVEVGCDAEPFWYLRGALYAAQKMFADIREKDIKERERIEKKNRQQNGGIPSHIMRT